MESVNFWDVHGVLFIIAMCFFPRLTMLFGTSVVFGPLAWIGWVLVPRLTCAILATTFYWNTNPVLVVFAWLWALGGESTEKKGVIHVSSSSS